jgi:hypothetical protein
MKPSKPSPRRAVARFMAMVILALAAPFAHAELKQQNLVHLIASSPSIVAGTVQKVSDGVDANGMPYTEVTLLVGASIKGSIEIGEYAFRQFGLTKPRTLPDGRRMLMVSPAEFPRWHENEYVVAFLYHPAARTGLQTTTGLAQGKFVKVNDKLVNAFGNAGLFADIEVGAGALSAAERRLLQSTGPVEIDAFMGLVRHVVKDELIQKGEFK